jgi:hypothetical protein
MGISACGRGCGLHPESRAVNTARRGIILFIIKSFDTVIIKSPFVNFVLSMGACSIQCAVSSPAR